jgi:Ca-activated chloride channel family protein
VNRYQGRFGITIALSVAGCLSAQQPGGPVFRVDVNLVVLTFNVLDQSNHLVQGLDLNNFKVIEDGIPQKPAFFTEGSRPAVRAGGVPDQPAGTSVFVLLDVSSRMYDTFARVCDAVADFGRALDPADSIAIYTFSRNMWRTAPLSKNTRAVRTSLGNVVAGDETALYDALLLTLRDAAAVPGRKIVVVFSNGPDTASVISPLDVANVAGDAGIPIFVLSTPDVQKIPSARNAFDLLTGQTGGALYIAKEWQQQADAFRSIRSEIASSYTIGYYPAPNPNRGFRHVQVQVAGPDGTKYHARVQPGYFADRGPALSAGPRSWGSGLDFDASGLPAR